MPVLKTLLLTWGLLIGKRIHPVRRLAKYAKYSTE